MLMIGFGETHSEPIQLGPDKGRMRDVHEYHLNFQCPWRLLSDGKPILKSGNDLMVGDSIDRHSDTALATLKEVIGQGQHEVLSISPEGTGGAVLSISDSVKLRIYAPLSGGEWRLFTYDPAPTYFVVERPKRGDYQGQLVIVSG
jgi:hypothetical protein